MSIQRRASSSDAFATGQNCRYCTCCVSRHLRARRCSDWRGAARAPVHFLNWPGRPRPCEGGRVAALPRSQGRRRRLSPGTAIVDPGDEVHRARNPGAEPTVVIATLLGAPAEGELTMPVDADEAAALDDRSLDTPGDQTH